MSDAVFQRALGYVLEHEGGATFTNDPVDPGGATRWGISLRYLRTLDGDIPGVDVDSDGDIDADDVRLMPRELATTIYHRLWKQGVFSELADVMPRVCIKGFDIQVNSGYRQSVKILQRALVYCGERVTLDGVVGRQTYGALQHYEVATGRELLLVKALCAAQKHFYDTLIVAKPQLKKYRNGWHRRASWKPE